MNIVAMHNAIRTFLDEHRTVRWEGDDIDDIINYVIKEIVNKSISPDGRAIKDKFEAVGKIRNELYPLLKTKQPVLSDYNERASIAGYHNGIPIAELPSDLRQNVRLSSYFHTLDAEIVTGTITALPAMSYAWQTRVDDTSIATKFENVNAGDLFVTGGKIYLIAEKFSNTSLSLETIIASDVIVTDGYKIYSGETIFIDGVEYVTRNEFTETVKKDPFQKPDLSIYPRRMYYFMDELGLRFPTEDIDFYPGIGYMDYIKEPTDVQGGIEYGPETDAGATLPAVADQNYIAVTESEYDPTAAGPNIIYQPNEEFVSSGGDIIYGVVAYDYVNCELPDSIHEEIVKRATELIGTIPDRASLLTMLDK